MRLTDEQIEAVDAFAGGGDLRLFAFAGTGKTTTLAAMADGARGPALYLAFNRAIAHEARALFPDGTRCATLHALAFRALHDDYGAGKLTATFGTADLVEILALKPRPHGPARLSPTAQAELVRATLQAFLHGAGEAPSPADVTLTAKLAAAPPADGLALIEATVTQVRSLWAQMIDPCNPVPFGHDGYLKLWALRRPRLAVDHLFIDEAQDSNPLVLDLARRQDAQIVQVGDPYQRIYAWRGAVDLLARQPAGRTAALTQSFRFGPAIADAANVVLAALGAPQRLTGNPAVRSRLGRCVPDAIVARTNAGVVDAVLDALTIGERPHVVGGTGELIRLLGGVDALKNGEGTAVPELAGYADWAEVQAASRDGVPGLRTLVALVEEYGEDRLSAALRGVEPDAAAADVTITTAHRAKGREWDRIRLADDFARAGGDDGPVDPAEARLLYVALTRARHAVDLPDELRDALTPSAADAA